MVLSQGYRVLSDTSTTRLMNLRRMRILGPSVCLLSLLSYFPLNVIYVKEIRSFGVNYSPETSNFSNTYRHLVFSNLICWSVSICGRVPFPKNQCYLHLLIMHISLFLLFNHWMYSLIWIICFHGCTMTFFKSTKCVASSVVVIKYKKHLP